MKRIALALVVAAVLFGAVYASASVLNVNGQVIQVGSDNKLWCDADGVEVDWAYENKDQTIYWITVHNIDPECVGYTMHVSLFDGAGDQFSQGREDITGPSMRINLSGSPVPAWKIEKINIGIDQGTD